MSDTPATGLGSTGLDTSDMKSLHRIFREAFSLAPRLVGEAPDGDASRAALVGSYYFNVLRLLQVHHEGEDELIWPKLYERCPEKTAMVEEVAGQHHDVVPLVDISSKQAMQWSATADAEDARELLGTLGNLETVLVRHLDQEEELVLPLCSQYIGQAEWGELPSHGMRSFDGDKPWLVMGLVREQLSPAQRSGMEGAFPPPVKEMWANFGQGAFDGFVSELRAPLSA